MSAEAPMFLILIHIFSNSHPTSTPNTCLKCFIWPKLWFGKFSYSNFKSSYSFWKNYGWLIVFILTCTQWLAPIGKQGVRNGQKVLRVWKGGTLDFNYYLSYLFTFFTSERVKGVRDRGKKIFKIIIFSSNVMVDTMVVELCIICNNDLYTLLLDQLNF